MRDGDGKRGGDDASTASVTVVSVGGHRLMEEATMMVVREVQKIPMSRFCLVSKEVKRGRSRHDESDLQNLPKSDLQNLHLVDFQRG